MSEATEARDRRSPVVPSRPTALRPLGLHDVTLTGGFWAERQTRNAASTIPHADGWIQRLGWVENFLPPERRSTRQRRGALFTDSDVYKLVEALVWEADRGGDPAMHRRVAELTTAIGSAIEPDGYLNTYYGHAGSGQRYSDLQHGHELYCAGHLIQAGVARLRTHGHDPLVDLAVRVADHITVQFGPNGQEGLCGHPEIELALVELGRATGDRRYLETAQAMIERRGHGLLGDHAWGRAYYQDDMPVREASVLRGHAVRALYLACGAADVAVETGDTALLAAVVQQWESTVATRTYLTGGMGSRHRDEGFGDAFELPPDHSYSETCAGIAAIMLSWRLLLATGECRYADHIERTLYNILATSPSPDGRSFFYSNTLHQRAQSWPAPRDHESQHAATGMRAPWFSVPCCPTNIARTLAVLGTYTATVTDDGLQLHQYATGHFRANIRQGTVVAVSARTDYPWDGQVNVRIDASNDQPWTLTLRIPSWATGAILTIGAERRAVEPGWVALRRTWDVGEELVLDLPMPPRWTYPDPRIDAVRGCVALERGPLVYCVESLAGSDSPDLDRLLIDPGAGIATEALPGMDPAVALIGRGVQRQLPEEERGMPYTVEPAPASPGPAVRGSGNPTPVQFIPYHLWAARGPSTMRVWFPYTI